MNLNDLIVRKICDRMPIYPRADDPNLSYELYRRRELYDFRLVPQPTESSPTQFPKNENEFTPLNSQELEKRIFSPLTPYKTALFFHGVGTGKTTLFSMIVEHNRSYMNALSEGLERKSALVLSPNDIISQNYLKDIRKVENYKLSEDRYRTKAMENETIRAMVSKSYEFFNIISFTNRLLRARNDEDPNVWKEFIEYWSGRIIIIDEAHKISVANSPNAEDDEEEEHFAFSESEMERYKVFHAFLHELKGCKVFLLSGTFVWDNIDEFPMRMNLILDLKNQLPMGKGEFLKAYYNSDGRTIREDKYDELMTIIGPYISYIRPDESNVERRYEGTILGNYGLEYTHTYESKASDLQNFWIPKIESIPKGDVKRKKDAQKKSKKSGCSNAARKLEISSMNFLFFGDLDESRENFCNEKCYECLDKMDLSDSSFDHRPCLNFFENHIAAEKVNGKKIRYKYKDKGLEKYIVEYLHILSPKFKTFIDILNDKKTNTELAFAYNEDVKQAGGCINMALILQAHGWHWIMPGTNIISSIVKESQFRPRFDNEIPTASSSSSSNQIPCCSQSGVEPKQSFIVLTGELDYMSPNERIAAIQAFNDQGNSCAQKIRLIIGSKAISTGIDIKNVRQYHVIRPHWNRSATDQAEGRVYRTGSHDALCNEEKYLRIFNHALTYSEGDKPTIDIEMYLTNEAKTAPIAGLVRLVKRAAYDCPFTYPRNVLSSDQPNSLTCDFQECNYVCRGFPEDSIDRSKPVWEYMINNVDDFIITTAIENYADKDSKMVEHKIYHLFSRYFAISEERIQPLIQYENDIPGYAEGLIKITLQRLKSNRTPIINKYGYRCYLKEYGNVWYLSENPYQNTYGDLESVKSLRITNGKTLSGILDAESMIVPKGGCVGGNLTDSIAYKVWNLIEEPTRDLYEEVTNISSGNVGIKINEFILKTYLEAINSTNTRYLEKLENLKNYVLGKSKATYYPIYVKENNIEKIGGFFHIAYGDQTSIPKTRPTHNTGELKYEIIRSQLANYIRKEMGSDPPAVKIREQGQNEEEEMVYEYLPPIIQVIHKYISFIQDYVKRNEIMPNPIDDLTNANLKTPLRIIMYYPNMRSDWQYVEKGSLEEGYCFGAYTYNKKKPDDECPDGMPYCGKIIDKKFSIVVSAELREKESKNKVRGGKGQECTSWTYVRLLELLKSQHILEYFAVHFDVFKEVAYASRGKRKDDNFNLDAEVKVSNISTNIGGSGCAGKEKMKCAAIKDILDRTTETNTQEYKNLLKILHYMTLPGTQRIQICNIVQKYFEMNNLLIT